MCLCGDWDPRQVDRKIADRKYRARMMDRDFRGPGGWVGTRDPYREVMGGEMMDGPPRIGLPPGLAAGLASSRGVPRPGTGSLFEPPMGSRSNAGGGSRYGESRHGDSRRGESRHGESRHGESRHGDSRHGESRHGDSRHTDDSRRASSRHSSTHEAASRPGAAWPPGPAEPFNRRGGPPPSGGDVWMHGALGGSQANVGRGRSSSRGRPASGDALPGSRAHAAAMATIRGPMPPGMQMGGRSNSRRSSRSGL